MPRMVLGLLLVLLPTDPGRQVLEVDVDLVNVTVTVTDGSGRHVGGLTREDFVIEDNGVPQTITHFSQESDSPITLGIALDTSGSMSQRMYTTRSALGSFLTRLGPEDETFILTYSDRPQLLVAPTSDTGQLLRALESVTPAGGTALYDALGETMRQVAEGSHDRRAVLLLSDGADTESRRGFPSTLEAVRRSDAVVYVLGVDNLSFSPVDVDVDVLESFTAVSGGKAYFVSGAWLGALDGPLEEIASELKSQYSIGYYPSSSDGAFHEIEVSLPGHVYTIRTRGGYQSPGTPLEGAVSPDDPAR